MAARVFLWATFLTPVVLLGNYFAQPAKVLPLAPQTTIHSQNGAMVASRHLDENGKEILWVLPLGMSLGMSPSALLWQIELSFDSPVAFSPDGRYLITGQIVSDPLASLERISPTDYTLECRETTTRARVWRRLEWINNSTTPLGPGAVAVSPDSALVAVAVVEGIRFYSLQTGEFVRFLPTGPVTLNSSVQLRFSPDGRTLTAALASGNRVWQMGSN